MMGINGEGELGIVAGGAAEAGFVVDVGHFAPIDEFTYQIGGINDFAVKDVGLPFFLAAHRASVDMFPGARVILPSPEVMLIQRAIFDAADFADRTVDAIGRSAAMVFFRRRFPTDGANLPVIVIVVLVAIVGVDVGFAFLGIMGMLARGVARRHPLGRGGRRSAATDDEHGQSRDQNVREWVSFHGTILLNLKPRRPDFDMPPCSDKNTMPPRLRGRRGHRKL